MRSYHVKENHFDSVVNEIPQYTQTHVKCISCYFIIKIHNTDTLQSVSVCMSIRLYKTIQNIIIWYQWLRPQRPLGELERGGEIEFSNNIFILDFKRIDFIKLIIFFLVLGGLFLRGDFSLEGVGNLPKNSYKPYQVL